MGEGLSSKCGRTRERNAHILPATDADLWPFSFPPLPDTLLSPREWRTGKVGLMVAGGPPWRLDLCQPNSVKIIISLCSLPVKA